MTSCAALSVSIVTFQKLSPFTPNQKFLGQLRYPMKLLSEARRPESRYILGFLSVFLLNLNVRITLSILGMFMFGEFKQLNIFLTNLSSPCLNHLPLRKKHVHVSLSYLTTRNNPSHNITYLFLWQE